MGPFPIPADSKTRIFSINVNLCQRLLGMEEFVNWLRQESGAIETDFISQGLKKIGEDAFEAPLIIDLDNRTSYLQAAKLCIRDCGLIFGALVGMPFDHKYYRIVNWAEGKFGKADKYVHWLAAQKTWIEPLLETRNALEHPKDGPSGQLHIRNVEFKFTTNGVSGEAPVWFLTGEPPTAIIIDAHNINKKILLLAEDLLAGTLSKLFPEVPFAIQVIPEERRDPKCSVRLELVPRGYFNGA
jgi:hypothetical protein